MSAPQLKDEGNKAFKGCSFSRAEELYSKAEQINPLDPFYPSNLSAALFEQAKYIDTIRAVARSHTKILDDPTRDKLLPKLSTRLARSLSLASRSGTLSPEILVEHENLIHELSELQSSAPECERAWKEWRRVEKDMERVKSGCEEARKRLASIPIRKRCPQPDVEFYAVGHDELMSILDDWGPEDELKRPLNLHLMSIKELERIAIFFAGVGDARHVFASIIGLSQLQDKLSEEKRQALNVHFTLNDIHPQALARDLCLFSLLDEIAQAHNDARREAELKMTILCTWMGLLMPQYCSVQLNQTMKSLKTKLLQTPPQLPSWLYVAPSSIPAIVKALDFWTSPTPKHFTTRSILKDYQRNQENKSSNAILNSPSASSSFRTRLEDLKRERRAEVERDIQGLTDEQVIEVAQDEDYLCPGLDQPRKRERWLAAARKLLVERVLSIHASQGSEAMDYGEEGLFLARLFPTFIPPSVLRSTEHVSLDNLWENLSKEISDDVASDVHTHILKTWKPNLAQSKAKVDMTTDINSVGNMIQIDHFNDRMSLYETSTIGRDCPSYSISSIFFDAVNAALAKLSGHVKLEVLLGEYNGELIKMRNGDDANDRPPEFPRQYTRMWLSNIPDYIGGPLAIATLTIPSLQNSDYASIAGNCLYNTSLWESGDHYVFNYSHLDCKEFERFFAGRIISMTPLYGVTEYAHGHQPIPLHVEQLPSRIELDEWLTRVLLGIIAAGNAGRDMRVRVQYPHTVAMFVHLLIRLCEIGYPSHWLSDYLYAVLHDQLTTEVVEYRGHAPIPMSFKGRRGPARKLNLDPWKFEFETLLALSYEVFPFPLQLPDDFARTAADITILEAPAPLFGFMTMSLGHGFHPVLMLVFHRKGHQPDKYTIPDIIEGRNVKKGDVYIVTVVDQLAVGKTTVRWRMSRQRVLNMRQERWELSVYRHDVNEYSEYLSTL
ncbi:hypothetical protein VNI00_003162 [Paramarasmius palmivorus]|uniref:DUF4470 domain-containing protein n=1 Tax=Paramarasmius palmivorus TaxID=297713 RepID=A0AAW0DTV8_9AGAR